MVKTLKVIFSLKENENEGLYTVIHRVLADYRSSKHGVTKETPYKLLFGREMNTRFSILRLPVVKERILNTQEKSIENYRGKRIDNFE